MDRGQLEGIEGHYWWNPSCEDEYDLAQHRLRSVDTLMDVIPVPHDFESEDVQQSEDFINSDELKGGVVFPRSTVPEEEPLSLSQYSQIFEEAEPLSLFPQASGDMTISSRDLHGSCDDRGILSSWPSVAQESQTDTKPPLCNDTETPIRILNLHRPPL